MLHRLFSAGTFLDRDVEAWHLSTWAFLIERLGDPSETVLATPTRDFFPPSDTARHARAEHVFECVKAAMGMTDWPCRLEAQPNRPSNQRVSDFLVVQTEGAANGTFRVEHGQVIITYAPGLLDTPWNLVATLAHELAHYLLLDHHDQMEEETEELATDLVVAYAGMGLFGANSAFSFDQQGDAFSQGWQSQRNGYLSPRSWAFALAVFVALAGGEETVMAHLKPEMLSLFKDARRYLTKRPALIDGLRPSNAP